MGFIKKRMTELTGFYEVQKYPKDKNIKKTLMEDTECKAEPTQQE